jgi:hypothetical protein
MDKDRQRLGLALLANGLALAVLIAAIVVAAPGTPLWVNAPVAVATNARSPPPCGCDCLGEP